jgi:hypothetical protein
LLSDEACLKWVIKLGVALQNRNGPAALMLYEETFEQRMLARTPTTAVKLEKAYLKVAACLNNYYFFKLNNDLPETVRRIPWAFHISILFYQTVIIYK